MEELPSNKQDIRKIEDKLKELEKKIDTLKSEKKKKKELTSQRSQSKLKEGQLAIVEKKSTLSTFGKKKGTSVTKILKKTQSDKYLMRPPRPQKEDKMEMTSSKHEESDLIHKFVTQVARTEAQERKEKTHHENVTCYYI